MSNSFPIDIAYTVRPAITPYIKTKEAIAKILATYCASTFKAIDAKIEEASNIGHFQTKVELEPLDNNIASLGVYDEIVRHLKNGGYAAAVTFVATDMFTIDRSAPRAGVYVLNLSWVNPPAKDFMLDGKQYQEAITDLEREDVETPIKSIDDLGQE